MKLFEGKVALVTGGTSGIGKATAIAFAKEGAKVVFSGSNSLEGEATLKLIKETGSEGKFICSEVSIENEIKQLIKETVADFGQIDFAFNNADIEGENRLLHQQSIEEFDKLISINLRGLFLCMKYEIMQMLSSGGGVIVNNSSMVGLISFRGISPYVASKHAVMGLTKSAAIEYAKSNIRINAINPDVFQTEMIDRFQEKRGSDAKQELTSIIPMARMATSDEIAAGVLLFCQGDKI